MVTRRFLLCGSFLLPLLLPAETFYFSHGQQQVLEPLENQRSVLNTPQSLRYFQDKNKRILGVADTLIVKFHSTQAEEAVIRKMDLEVVKRFHSGALLVKTSADVLDVANTLYAMEEVEYAHPDFYQEKQKRFLPAAAIGLAAAVALDGCGGGGSRNDVSDSSSSSTSTSSSSTSSPSSSSQSSDNLLPGNGSGGQTSQSLTSSSSSSLMDVSITDPYYPQEWHLNNTGQNGYTAGADINAEEAWAYTRGAGAIVGILDDGFDIYHQELDDYFLGAKDYRDGDADPSPGWIDSHGTACLGVMLAEENGVGVVGVAPQAHYYAARQGYGDSDDIQALEWLAEQGVAVISNSWGSYAVSDALRDTLNDLATNGRNGKGIVITFAVGNDRYDLDDAAYDDESEVVGVIGVAASTEYDTRASYSNYGSAVDIAAPGSENYSIVTTDVSGDKGYNSGDYHMEFVGTSAAAPMVAGVAALVLSVNPDLSAAEVKNILSQSADKIGEDSYNSSGWNKYLGFGRVNAGKAVQKAMESRSFIGR